LNKFTYEDYLLYKHVKLLTLQEESTQFHYEKSLIYKYHDKTFKELFSNRKEAVTFINKALHLVGTDEELAEKI
jgi:hypothetical protein